MSIRKRYKKVEKSFKKVLTSTALLCIIIFVAVRNNETKIEFRGVAQLG